MRVPRQIVSVIASLVALALVRSWMLRPPIDPTSSPNESDIEVGATEGDLRYWRAKEAVRQGEGRLTAQAAIRTALEARATALTGWAAVSFLAATGAGFTAKDAAGIAGSACTGCVLFGAAIVGIHAVRPRDWSMVGYDPEVITSDPLPSELEVLESFAAGLSIGIQANNLRLNAMGRMLRWAGWMLIVAPACGAAAYWKVPALIEWTAAAFQRFHWGAA